MVELLKCNNSIIDSPSSSLKLSEKIAVYTSAAFIFGEAWGPSEQRPGLK